MTRGLIILSTSLAGLILAFGATKDAASACDYFCQQNGGVITYETRDDYFSRRNGGMVKQETCDYFCQQNGGKAANEPRDYFSRDDAPTTAEPCDYFCRRKSGDTKG